MESARQIRAHIMAMPLSDAVREVMHQLAQHGAQAYVVGGAVRDWVWHPESFNADTTDWDIATNADPVLLEQLAAQHHPGERFGTFSLAQRVEVTVMRVDGAYRDHRHPEWIHPAADIMRDLRRRDFTANGAAFDGRRVVAVAHALQDLAARRLRAIGSPQRRFSEDPLRILRLVRLMAVHGASVEERTWNALQDMAAQGALVSRERRLAELVKFLQAPVKTWGLWNAGGLAAALEWPPGWDDGCAKRVAAPPVSAPARLAAFALISVGSLTSIREWIRTWPLPKEWREALITVERRAPVIDPVRWGGLARRPGQRYAAVFRQLAAAWGMESSQLEPLVLALSAADLQRRWHLYGPRLGRVLRDLADTVAQNPELNQPERLAALVDTFLA
jgi:tRNA nucleotidyltransferase (CCA-adding enzyme)